MLKPGAALPGNVTDDSQWMPARKIKNGKVTSDEEAKRDDEETVWTLPEVVTTQAIRFTHTAQSTDRSFAGFLGGAALFPGRWTNLAPQAIASAGASDQYSYRLNDETARAGWENISNRDGDRAQTIPQNPEWAMLTWSQPVTLGGVGLLGNEFGTVEIQAYAGPENKHPRDASDADWKTVQTVSGPKLGYSAALDLAVASFASPVTTRALRLRFTAAMEEGLNPFNGGHTRGGKRVAVGEWMAFRPLDTAPLEAAILPGAKMRRNASADPDQIHRAR